MSYWPETTFQVGSDARVANFFYIDHPLLNGRPDARLFVTPVAGSYSAYSGNVVGVWYSHSSGQWSVYNESGTSMSGGQLFNVSLGGYEGQRSFVHATTSVNTYYNVTYLDHPTLNGNPYGRPIVTHVWNPPGHAANYHNEVTGLFYDSNRKQWAIYNEDWTTMATGRTFNVIAASAADAWVGLWPTSMRALFS